MNRIEEKMKVLTEQGKKAFITYLTAGLPDLEKTEELIFVQEAAGIDIIEVGIPFSDPVADGPVIQGASCKALANGTTIGKIFEMMKNARQKGADVPIVFMMYYNSILHYGIDVFVKKCIECGVDGLIVPDLPYEEQDELNDAIAKNDAAPILIQLISPVSRQRIPMILKNARGFVYCVSQMGVTGKGSNFHAHLLEYLSEVKKISKIPVMMGFGIRTAEDVKPMADVIDGAIVGSHFITILEESNFSNDVVTEYITSFKKEMNQ